jgi:hypothetical protein
MGGASTRCVIRSCNGLAGYLPPDASSLLVRHRSRNEDCLRAGRNSVALSQAGLVRLTALGYDVPWVKA